MMFSHMMIYLFIVNHGKQGGWFALKHVPNPLSDKESLTAIVKKSLSYEPDKTPSDKPNEMEENEGEEEDYEMVLAAVKQYGVALQYAPYNLKNNRKIVLAAVNQDGEALQYASEQLKFDREIILAALLQSNWGALKYASEELSLDSHFVLTMIVLVYWDALLVPSLFEVLTNAMIEMALDSISLTETTERTWAAAESVINTFSSSSSAAPPPPPITNEVGDSCRQIV
jgi:hypothetical protein